MADAYEVGRRTRAHLLKFNVEKIEQAYLQAIKAGEERPVILIIDLRDKMGFELASRLESKKTKQVREECNKRDVIPTALIATSLPVAVKVIGSMTPAGRETLQKPLPEGRFWVVSISAGGNSYAAMRIPVAPSSDP